MDLDRFDSLAWILTTTSSRRSLTRLLGGFTLGGPFALSGLRSVEAKCKKTCGPCKRCRRGKCKPKPAGTACAGGTCQGGSCLPTVVSPTPPAPTCTDGIRNGSETDLDCGGTCPRCADFQTCASRDDCRSALCVGDVCRVCDPTTPGQCGIDGVGICMCQSRDDGQRFCAQSKPVEVTDCLLCPPGTNCVDIGASHVRCFKPCGAT